MEQLTFRTKTLTVNKQTKLLILMVDLVTLQYITRFTMRRPINFTKETRILEFWVYHHHSTHDKFMRFSEGGRGVHLHNGNWGSSEIRYPYYKQSLPISETNFWSIISIPLKEVNLVKLAALVSWGIFIRRERVIFAWHALWLYYIDGSLPAYALESWILMRYFNVPAQKPIRDDGEDVVMILLWFYRLLWSLYTGQEDNECIPVVNEHSVPRDDYSGRKSCPDEMGYSDCSWRGLVYRRRLRNIDEDDDYIG